MSSISPINSYRKSASKRLLLLIAFFAIAHVAHAQIYASCTHRNIYKYNDITDEVEYLYGYDENSMFKFNSNLTMFEHTTPEMSSSYYISDSDFDEDKSTLTMDVVSDVGNNYCYILDFDDNMIKVIYESDETIYMVVFTIKKLWKDD